jgi:peptidyl-prolyl cis-trans isomerase D
VLDASFEVDPQKLPGYTGVKGPDGFVVVRVEHAAPGKLNPTLQATLPLQLGQALGQAEEKAVLQAMKTAVGVKMLPEAEKALAGEDSKDQG